MKKKIINGLLMVALLFATTSAFVSCKDNDADVNTELKGQILSLESTIQKLQGELASIKNSIPPSYDDTVLLNQILKLQDQLNELNSKLIAAQSSALTKEEFTAITDPIIAELSVVEAMVALVAEQVTFIPGSIVAEGAYNPVFGSFAIPTNNKSLILASYMGNYNEAVSFHGERIAAGNRMSDNAGKLYFTINPNNINIENGTFSLVNSQDQAAKVQLTVTPSSDVLKWGWTRAAAENGFYEANVKITDLKAVEFNYLDFVNDIKTAIDKNTTSSLKELVISLYSAITSGNHERLALKYEAKGKIGSTEFSLGSVRTGYDLGLFSVKPLSYDFEIELSEEALEDISNNTYIEIGKDENTNQGVVRYIDASKVIQSINQALQPMLLVKENNKIHSPYTVDAGTITLIPTSSTAEVFAPAYKKYVKVECDDQLVKDFGVFDGTINELELTVEKGKTYKVTYDAIDFYGVERNKEYTIKVNE